MPGTSGLLFTVTEPSRAGIIQGVIARDQTFTDVFSAPDFSPRDRDICFISLDGRHIHYAALAMRGVSVATALVGVRFVRIVHLDELPIGAITEHLGARFQKHLQAAAEGAGRRLPPKTWAEMMNTVKLLRPQAQPMLERLEQERRASQRPLNTRGFQTVAMEKDAVGLALSIFGYDRRTVLGSHALDQSLAPAPFLRGLAPSYLIEDQIIQHDSSFFGEWEPLREHVTTAAEFGLGNERLTIFNVNRTPLERSLGVDLLYYHHVYGSYVLVQYKVMKRPKQYGQAELRPDSRMREEIRRMEEFEEQYGASDDDATALSYRLHPGLFLLKLCHRVEFEADSTGLLPGMYIPLDYYQLLVSSGQATGPRGGTVLTHENVRRYLSNTLFVQLVQRGWIGSRGSVSDAVSLIAERARTGRDAVVAIADEGELRGEHSVESDSQSTFWLRTPGDDYPTAQDEVG